MRNGRFLNTELFADKQETVCKRLALYEILGVEIDTELGIVLLRLGEYEIRIFIEQGVLTVELADDIDLVLGGCTGRYNHLQENGIRLGLKLRLFMLKPGSRGKCKETMYKVQTPLFYVLLS